MAINVTSETGQLKRVLLHRPGQELERLMPENLDELLFDDIPFLKAAQQEHDTFAQALRENGAQVVYLADLVAETLRADPALREAFVEDFIGASGAMARHYASGLRALLLAEKDEKALVLHTMAGVAVEELDGAGRGPLCGIMASRFRFAADPIPNLYFTRDPFACIGCGASLNHMGSKTRHRETLYGRTVLTHHPHFAGRVPLYYRPEAPFSIEGGDILNLSRRVLAVGVSQRTTPEAVELLAQALFREGASEVDTVLVLHIPSLRAYMHLDTVFTQVDTGKFTVHPGILAPLQLYVLEKQDDSGAFTVRESGLDLADTLKAVLGLARVDIIPCGGGDHVSSAREQWNDGANTLCVSPGVVVCYDRNTVTNRILRESGICVLEVPSSELSRGRGGPRCMSMPLERA